MFRPRNLVVLVAAISVTACGSAPFDRDTAARFDTHPLAFHNGPTMTQELSHTTITNEAELVSAAERIKSEAFEPVEEDAPTSTSARSTISLL